jgi:hypothetical protein
MRNLLLFGLILSLLTLNSGATAPLQLSGVSGQSILAKVASVNITTDVSKASGNDLWNWGKIPYNYELNDSGILHETASGPGEDNAWLETRINDIKNLNTSGFD